MSTCARQGRQACRVQEQAAARECVRRDDRWRLSVEKPRARCAEGSAICTIVTSSVTISCSDPQQAGTTQRLDAGSGVTRGTPADPAGPGGSGCSVARCCVGLGEAIGRRSEV